jgi:ArsR family transcriptional regulator, arsenate/arsenite/antimonite-responsive transcriptional repressor
MLKTYLKVMKALSDRNRVKIIKMLQSREMCVCEMQAALELAQPSVSKHLKVLEEAGLVESRKDGLWVNYRVPDRAESLYARHMLSALHGWLNDDPEIEQIVQVAGGLDRCEISGSCRPVLRIGKVSAAKQGV